MKMHGLGNDFVVIDERDGLRVTDALVIAMADRHCGVGYDQLVALRDAPGHALELIFWNADGSIAGACGNATRCIAQYEMDRTGVDHLNIKTARGSLQAWRAADGMVSVNMGAPILDWTAIPLAQDVDLLNLPIEGRPVATGMGNPHCTFFVDDVATVDVAARGAEIEHHPLFPERTNVQFVQKIGPDHLRMRVWERGAGITLASGSSSCAVVVAAARRGITGRQVTVDLDGGRIDIEWREDGVIMTGPTAYVFDGLWRGAR